MHVEDDQKYIILVDDLPLIRQGLRVFVEKDPALTVCAEAGCAREALELCASMPVDLALVDLSLGEDCGLELIKDLRIQFPHIKVLAVSMRDECLYAERVLRAGAYGFVSKEVDPAQLQAAIHSALRGEPYASPKVTRRLLESARETGSGSLLEQLSDRELAVFQWIGEGLGTSEIAKKMALGIKTIETYRARLRKKLQMESSSELLRMAVDWNLRNG